MYNLAKLFNQRNYTIMYKTILRFPMIRRSVGRVILQMDLSQNEKSVIVI